MKLILTLTLLLFNLQILAGPFIQGVSGNAQYSSFLAKSKEIRFNESEVDFSYFGDLNSDSYRRSFYFSLGAGYGQITSKKYSNSFGILRAQSAYMFRLGSENPIRIGPSISYIHRPGWNEKESSDARKYAIPTGLMFLFDFSESKMFRSIALTLESKLSENTRKSWAARIGLNLGWSREDATKYPSFVEASEKTKNPLFGKSSDSTKKVSNLTLKIRDPLFRFPPERITLFDFHEVGLKKLANFYMDHKDEWSLIKINHLTRDEEQLAKGFRRSARVAQKLIQAGLHYKKVQVGGNYIVANSFLPNNDAGVEFEVTLNPNANRDAFIEAYENYLSRKINSDQDNKSESP